MEKHREDITFNFQDHLLGGVSSPYRCGCGQDSISYDLRVQASIDATGSPLTDEALTAAKNADAVFLGAVGGPVCLVSSLAQIYL